MRKPKGGFSLLSTMAAVAVVGVLMVAVGKYLLNSIGGAKYITNKSDEEQVARDVMMSLARPEICRKSLFASNSGNAQAGVVTIPSNVDPTDPTFNPNYRVPVAIRVGSGRIDGNSALTEEQRKVVGTSLITIQSELTNFILMDEAKQEYAATLHLRFKQVGGSGAEELRRRSINIILSTIPRDPLDPDPPAPDPLNPYATDRLIQTCRSVLTGGGGGFAASCAPGQLLTADSAGMAACVPDPPCVAGQGIVYAEILDESGSSLTPKEYEWQCVAETAQKVKLCKSALGCLQ